MNLIINNLIYNSYIGFICILLSMKNNKISINEKIVNACELPKDVMWGASIISITGNREIYIENFKNIIKFFNYSMQKLSNRHRG